MGETIWRKWSFLLLLLLCGGFVLTATGSWKAVWQPTQVAKEKLLAFGVQLGSEEKEGAENPDNGENSGLPDEDESIVNAGNAGNDVTVPEVTDDSLIDAEDYGEEAGGAEGENMKEPEVTWRDPSQIVYTTVEDDYFSDAVFIGDSRTVGMFEYGGLENISTFYASTGLTVYTLFEADIVQVPGQKEKITIEQALSERQFSKIYLMLGINEMGRGDLEGFLNQYSQVVAHLKELQPDAVIYLQGIMKVTTERSDKGDYIHNQGIEERNAGIAALADNVQVYYLDVNTAICDESGGMEPSYTTDGVHLMARYIPLWKEFLKQHAVVLD